jgi:hypothetical protein
VSSLHETILEVYPPVVESQDVADTIFKQADITLVGLQGAIKSVGAAVRKLSKSRRDFASSLSSFRYYIGGPTREIMAGHNYEIRRIFCEGLKRHSDFFIKKVCFF